MSQLEKCSEWRAGEKRMVKQREKQGVGIPRACYEGS